MLNFFKCLSAILYSSVESSMFRSVLHYFIGLFVLLMTSFLSSLYILEIRPLSDVGLMKIFFHSVGCRLILLTMSFALLNLFSYMRSHLLNVSLTVFATGVIFRKWSLVPMQSSVLLTFSSIMLSVAGFMLRSLILLDLSFVHNDKYEYIFNLLHVDIQLCQHHLLNMLSLFHFMYFLSLSKIRYSKVCRLLFGSSIQFHWSSCLFFCQ